MNTKEVNSFIDKLGTDLTTKQAIETIRAIDRLVHVTKDFNIDQKSLVLLTITKELRR